MYTHSVTNLKLCHRLPINKEVCPSTMMPGGAGAYVASSSIAIAKALEKLIKHLSRMLQVF